MNKRLLAGGKIIVWQEGEQTILHHQNGLTLQLTAQETQDLKAWLDEQDATWAERAEWESEQRMKEEQEITSVPVESELAAMFLAEALKDGKTITIPSLGIRIPTQEREI